MADDEIPTFKPMRKTQRACYNLWLQACKNRLVAKVEFDHLDVNFWMGCLPDTSAGRHFTEERVQKWLDDPDFVARLNYEFGRLVREVGDELPPQPPTPPPPPPAPAVQTERATEPENIECWSGPGVCQQTKVKFDKKKVPNYCPDFDRLPLVPLLIMDAGQNLLKAHLWRGQHKISFVPTDDKIVAPDGTTIWEQKGRSVLSSVCNIFVLLRDESYSEAAVSLLSRYSPASVQTLVAAIVAPSAPKGTITEQISLVAMQFAFDIDGRKAVFQNVVREPGRILAQNLVVGSVYEFCSFQSAVRVLHCTECPPQTAWRYNIEPLVDLRAEKIAERHKISTHVHQCNVAQCQGLVYSRVRLNKRVFLAVPTSIQQRQVTLAKLLKARKSSLHRQLELEGEKYELMALVVKLREGEVTWRDAILLKMHPTKLELECVIDSEDPTRKHPLDNYLDKAAVVQCMVYVNKDFKDE